VRSARAFDFCLLALAFSVHAFAAAFDALVANFLAALCAELLGTGCPDPSYQGEIIPGLQKSQKVPLLLLTPLRICQGVASRPFSRSPAKRQCQLKAVAIFWTARCFSPRFPVSTQNRKFLFLAK